MVMSPKVRWFAFGLHIPSSARAIVSLVHFISKQVQAVVVINLGHHYSEKGSTNTELNNDILVLYSHSYPEEKKFVS